MIKIMRNRMTHINHRAAWIFSLIFLLLIIPVTAQENQPVRFKRWIVGVEGMLGFGFNNFCLGRYEKPEPGYNIYSEQPYYLNTGGGFGYSVLTGYRINSYMECLVEMGRQKPGLSNHISGVEGNFYRDMACLTLKLNVPLQNDDWDANPYLFFGGGGGLYSGKMILKNAFIFDDYFNRFRYNFQYEKTMGYHAIIGLEMSLPSFSLYLNGRLHLVQYRLKSLTIDQTKINVENVADEYRSIKSDGLDLVLGFHYYF